MDLKIIITNPIKLTSNAIVPAQLYLDLPKLLSSQSKCELVATPLVLEAIDAPQGLSHGDVEDKVGEGEKRDWYPAVPALEARGLRLSQESKAQENEEELEELLKLLLLEVD